MNVKEVPADTKFRVGYAVFIYTREDHALDESDEQAAVSVENSKNGIFQIKGDLRVQLL